MGRGRGEHQLAETLRWVDEVGEEMPGRGREGRRVRMGRCWNGKRSAPYSRKLLPRSSRSLPCSFRVRHHVGPLVSRSSITLRRSRRDMALELLQRPDEGVDALHLLLGGGHGGSRGVVGMMERLSRGGREKVDKVDEGTPSLPRRSTPTNGVTQHARASPAIMAVSSPLLLAAYPRRPAAAARIGDGI